MAGQAQGLVDAGHKGHTSQLVGALDALGRMAQAGIAG